MADVIEPTIEDFPSADVAQARTGLDNEPGNSLVPGLVPARRQITSQKERIVVVGGGAGGLELVVRLARKLKRDRNVDVVLIDKNPSHIWKPLFHEVATGSMNSHHDEASYRVLDRYDQPQDRGCPRDRSGRRGDHAGARRCLRPARRQRR